MKPPVRVPVQMATVGRPVEVSASCVSHRFLFTTYSGDSCSCKFTVCIILLYFTTSG